MSECHSFDVDVAKDVGINAAIIFKSFCFWIKKNASEDQNFKNGDYWSYSSIKGLSKIFEYMTEKQIRTAIDLLIEKKYLKKDQLCDNKVNRTMWYSLAEKGKSICQIGQVHSPSRANANAEKGKSNIEDTEKKLLKEDISLPTSRCSVGRESARGAPPDLPAQPEQKKTGQKAKRKTRLPDDWFLPKDWGEWAIAQGMTEHDVREEADRFADHWRSNGETKVDWMATWRNWVRRRREFARASPVKPRKKTFNEQWKEYFAEKEAKAKTIEGTVKEVGNELITDRTNLDGNADALWKPF